MSGPCLCGDPYCPRCGDPGLAVMEAAEDWAIGELQQAKLSPDEYRLVVSVGLAAVLESRKYAEGVLTAYKAILVEAAMYKDAL